MIASLPLLGFRPDPSCFRGLRWRLDLDLDSESLLVLGESMRTLGFTAVMEVLFPSLISLENSAGHQVIFVAKTGRVQIRIHYEIELQLREPLARQIAAEIVDVATSQGLLAPAALSETQ